MALSSSSKTSCTTSSCATPAIQNDRARALAGIARLCSSVRIVRPRNHSSASSKRSTSAETAHVMSQVLQRGRHAGELAEDRGSLQHTGQLLRVELPEGLVEPGPEIVEVGSGGDHVENSLQVRLDGLGEPCCAVLGQSIDVLLPLDKSGIGRDGRPGGESDDGRCLALLAWWRLLWRRLPEGRVLGGRGRLGALPWLGPADVVGLEELLAVDLEPEPLSSVKHVESLPLGLTLGLAVLLRLDRVARPRGELAISEVVLGPPDQGLVVDRRGERLGV